MPECEVEKARNIIEAEAKVLSKLIVQAAQGHRDEYYLDLDLVHHHLDLDPDHHPNLMHLLIVIPIGKKRKARPIWFSAANSSDTGRPLNSCFSINIIIFPCHYKPHRPYIVIMIISTCHGKDDWASA